MASFSRAGDFVDGELYVPMYGMIQSFNVSVAAAVILPLDQPEVLDELLTAGVNDSKKLAARTFIVVCTRVGAERRKCAQHRLN